MFLAPLLYFFKIKKIGQQQLEKEAMRNKTDEGLKRQKQALLLPKVLILSNLPIRSAEKTEL